MTELLMSGDINPEGLQPNSKPSTYRGVALTVVRDPEVGPILAFDGNGTVLYADRTLLLDVVNLAVPYTVQGIIDALNGETS